MVIALSPSAVTTSRLLLARIGANGAQVPSPLQRELIAEARTLYGNCITVPDLNTTPVAGYLSAQLKDAPTDKWTRWPGLSFRRMADSEQDARCLRQ